jgi:hypothetical protein
MQVQSACFGVLFGRGEGTESSRAVAFWGLDLDDVCSETSEESTSPRSCDSLGKFNDSDSVERWLAHWLKRVSWMCSIKARDSSTD